MLDFQSGAPAPIRGYSCLMRRFAPIGVVLLVLCLWIPGQAQAFKPEIVKAYATADNEGLRFTVKVRMDKGHRSERKVKVTYQGVTKNAPPVRSIPLSFYEAGPYSGPIERCYRIFVVAKNHDGTTREEVKAGRIGTNGCRR